MRLMKVLREQGVDASLLVQEGAGDDTGVYSTTHGILKRWRNFLSFALERLFFLRHEKNKEVRFLFSPANTGEQVITNKHVQEADLIHLHWINAGFLSLRSLDKLISLGKPVVWTFHDMWAITGGCHHALDCEGYKQQCGNCPYLKKPGKTDLSHSLWKKKNKLFKNANITVITPSRWLQERVRESSLFEGMDVHAIPNVVDPSLFLPREREQACGKLGLDPSKRYILFGAASVRNLYKGFGFFQEAIRDLNEDQDALKGVEILLFGKTGGEVSEAFPVKSHWFDYVDSIETMNALYSVAHMYVISSLQDTYPTTLIESMLCGTPVVGFRTGGIPEMIDHLGDGYLADYKSVADLARGMRWVLFNDKYKTLRMQVRKEAIFRFSREKSAALHLELYENILQSSGK